MSVSLWPVILKYIVCSRIRLHLAGTGTMDVQKIVEKIQKHVRGCDFVGTFSFNKTTIYKKKCRFDNILCKKIIADLTKKGYKLE